MRRGLWTAACLCMLLLLTWTSGLQAQDPADPTPDAGVTGGAPPADETTGPGGEQPAAPVDPTGGATAGEQEQPADPDPVTPDTPADASTGSEDPADPVPGGDEPGPPGPEGPAEQSSTGSDEGEPQPQPPRVCSAVPPAATGISIPLYLVDHHTAGATWHPDFFMLRGFQNLADDEVQGERPSFCTGDLPRGCTEGCAEAECGRSGIDGLALNQVAPELDATGAIVYRNSAAGDAPSLGGVAASNPELVPAFMRHSIHSAESFSSWFKLSEAPSGSGDSNYELHSASFAEVPWPADQPPSNLKHYRWSCDPCFPLDRTLFGNENDAQLFRTTPAGATEPVDLVLSGTHSHNYGFTAQAHSTFAWRGGLPGEFLRVYASDDAFVFIDGRLVIDLGGAHQQLLCRTLNLNTGALTGGPAAYFDGEYSCPDTAIPASFQAAPFDPALYAERDALKFSMYFTQRSAPGVVGGKIVPVMSTWRVETSVDLAGGVALSSAVPAYVPPNAPVASLTSSVDNPAPAFTVSNKLVQLSNSHLREPLELNDASDVFLHQGADNMEVLLISVNTIPTEDVTVTCTDPLGKVTMDPITFPACEDFTVRATTMFWAAEGSSTVICTLSSESDTNETESTTSNFVHAPPVRFDVHVLGANQAPVAIAEIEGAVGFAAAPVAGAQGDVFALLNGARSYDPDGLVEVALWELVSPLELASPPQIESPTTLNTYVRNLQLGTSYEFKLSVTDDMPEGYAITSQTTLVVKVPEANPYPAEVPADPADSAVVLQFQGLDLDRQVELNNFNRAALHSLRRFVLDILGPGHGHEALSVPAPEGEPAPTATPTSLDETVLLANRAPYKLGEGEVASTVALTFVLRAAVSETMRASELAGRIVSAASDPASSLRTEQPSLISAAVVEVPAEIQAEASDSADPSLSPLQPNALADGGDGSSYSRAGMWVGVALAVLIGLALLSFASWWLFGQWRKRRNPMSEHETASIMRASPRNNGALPMSVPDDATTVPHYGIDSAVNEHPIMSPGGVQMHRIEEGSGASSGRKVRDGVTARSDDIHLTEEPL